MKLEHVLLLLVFVIGAMFVVDVASRVQNQTSKPEPQKVDVIVHVVRDCPTNAPITPETPKPNCCP